MGYYMWTKTISTKTWRFSSGSGGITNHGHYSMDAAGSVVLDIAAP